jgi:hypothetical protein
MSFKLSLNTHPAFLARSPHGASYSVRIHGGSSVMDEGSSQGVWVCSHCRYGCNDIDEIKKQ